MNCWGTVPIGSVLPFSFGSYDGTTGASEAITGLAVTDIEIYKGVSMTQRASDAGYTLLDTDGIDVDGHVGINGFSVDTGDDTDAGFFAAGSFYTVVVASITADGQTVNFVAGTFRLCAAETAAGVPVADLTHVGGDSRGAYIVKGTAVAIANGSITLAAGQGTTLSGVESLLIVLTGGTNAIGKSRYINHDAGDVFTVDPAWNAGETLPSGTITYIVLAAPPSPVTTIPASNITQILGAAVDTAQAQLGVSVVNVTTAAAQDILTEVMVEAYAADGAAPTLAQAVLAIQQWCHEKAISGTTATIKKLDGTTTAMTFTLNDATTPTSITRAT